MQAGPFTESAPTRRSSDLTASASLPLTVIAPLAISTTAIPSGTAGSNYSTTLGASGGAPPYTWSGAGVNGLTLSAAGVLSGTPMQAGAFTETATVRDSADA